MQYPCRFNIGIYVAIFAIATISCAQVSATPILFDDSASLLKSFDPKHYQHSDVATIKQREESFVLNPFRKLSGGCCVETKVLADGTDKSSYKVYPSECFDRKIRDCSDDFRSGYTSTCASETMAPEVKSLCEQFQECDRNKVPGEDKFVYSQHFEHSDAVCEYIEDSGSQNPSLVTCVVLDSSHIGQPAPTNANIYFSDGRQEHVVKGQIAPPEFEGQTFCPCIKVPAGTVAPVRGVWTGMQGATYPVHAGEKSIAAGTFCAVPSGSPFNATANNICRNPGDFNPDAHYNGNEKCINLARTCHAFKDLGGIVPLYRSMLTAFVPLCCNGNPEYNDESGCGASEISNDNEDYCNGGEFEPNTIAEVDCRSPVDRENNPEFDEDVEECHTEACRSSALGCIAARGKANSRSPGKTYSMELQPTEKTCSQVATERCTYAKLNFGPISFPCTYDGGFCMDANCQKSKEECLKRGSTLNPATGQLYPPTMKWTPTESLNFEDPSVHVRFTNNNRHIQYSLQKCCKTGAYTDGCLPEEFKKVQNKYSLCKNPDQFRAIEKNAKDHCELFQSCADKFLQKGVCYDPQNPEHTCLDQWTDENGVQRGCAYNEIDCKERNPTFSFRSFTHFDLALDSVYSRYNSATCCADYQLSDTCDIGKDSFLTAALPSPDLCKDMRSYQPHGYITTYSGYNDTCRSISHRRYTSVIFSKGRCGLLDHAGNIEEKCHTPICHESKEGCEATGNAFVPYSAVEVSDMNAYYRNRYGSACCGGPENVNDFYSITKFVKNGPLEAQALCGEGTIWKDGSGCIPTRKGMIDACKKSRGRWGWTCDREAFCGNQ